MNALADSHDLLVSENRSLNKRLNQLLLILAEMQNENRNKNSKV